MSLYKECAVVIDPADDRWTSEETKEQEQDQSEQYDRDGFRNPGFRNFYHSLQRLHTRVQENIEIVQQMQQRIIYRDKILSRYSNIDYWRRIVRQSESRAKACKKYQNK